MSMPRLVGAEGDGAGVSCTLEYPGHFEARSVGFSRGIRWKRAWVNERTARRRTVRCQRLQALSPRGHGHRTLEPCRGIGKDGKKLIDRRSIASIRCQTVP